MWHYAVFPFEVLINRPPHSWPTRKRTLNSPKCKQAVTAERSRKGQKGAERGCFLPFPFSFFLFSFFLFLFLSFLLVNDCAFRFLHCFVVFNIATRLFAKQGPRVKSCGMNLDTVKEIKVQLTSVLLSFGSYLQRCEWRQLAYTNGKTEMSRHFSRFVAAR